MTELEFHSFLKRNKQKFDKAMDDFDRQSIEFDKKINKILSKF